MTITTTLESNETLLQQLARQIELTIRQRDELESVKRESEQLLTDLDAAKARSDKAAQKAEYSDELLRELSQLQESYARSSEAFRLLTREHEALKQEAKNTAEQSLEREGELSERLLEMQRKMDETLSSTTELMDARARHEHEIAALTKDILSEREQAKELAAAIEQEANKREQLESSYAQLQEVNALLKQQSDQVEQQLARLRESQTEALQEQSRLREQRDQQAVEIAKLTRWLLTAEQRLVGASFAGSKERPADGSLHLKDDIKLLQKSPLFDADWYKKTYSDVAKAGIDPAEHYLRHGGFENRHPSPHFDSGWYLLQYPDVKRSGANPLIHYLLDGEKQGCLPKPEQSHG